MSSEDKISPSEEGEPTTKGSPKVGVTDFRAQSGTEESKYDVRCYLIIIIDYKLLQLTARLRCRSNPRVFGLA